jgi:hypothetical protein
MMEEPVSAQNIERPQQSSNTLLKILVLFGILFMLAGSAYVGYWYGKSQTTKVEPVTSQPVTTTETSTEPPNVEVIASDWKSYANSDFGVSFLYPSNLYIPVVSNTYPSPTSSEKLTEDLKTAPIILLRAKEQTNSDKGVGPIIFEKIFNTTMDAWLEENKNAAKTAKGYYFHVSDHTMSKTTFNGFNGYLLKLTRNQFGPTDKQLVQVDKDVYKISYPSNFPVPGGAGTQEYNDYMDKNENPIIKSILDSLEFVK